MNTCSFSILLLCSLVNDSLAASLPSECQRLPLCIRRIQLRSWEVQSHSESWSFMWARMPTLDACRALSLSQGCAVLQLVWASSHPFAWAPMGPFEQGTFVNPGGFSWITYVTPLLLFLWLLAATTITEVRSTEQIFWQLYFSLLLCTFWLCSLGDFLKCILWYLRGVPYVCNQIFHFPELFCSLNIHTHTLSGTLLGFNGYITSRFKKDQLFIPEKLLVLSSMQGRG